MCNFSILLMGQSTFSDYFQKGAIRYDFDLVGNCDLTTVVHQQTKYLPYWGGNPNVIVDSFYYGTYQYLVFDIKTKELIFRKGFSPLFWEWQMTLEAKRKSRAYSNAIFFPTPKADVEIVIQTRDDQNEWKSIFNDTLFVDDYHAVRELPVSYLIDTIQYNGDSDKKIDLVFLPEGYQSSELEHFINDVGRFTDTLWTVAPFDRYRDRFNVFAIHVPSVESGSDLTGEKVYRNTAFNSQYYTFDSPRYLTTNDMKSVYDALDGVGWDYVSILVNHERYGGGGFYNFLSICSSHNEYSPFVFCHEFAHEFAGLGDEYYSSPTAFDEYQSTIVEPWEPNLTTLIDSDVKWKSLMSSDTPVPTPRDSVFMHTVGVFEGGAYVAKGVYSPMMSCWMKERVAGKFCPVCQKAIETTILSQTK
jgi:hypothetical protein